MCFRHTKTLNYFSGFFSRLWYLTAICGERLLGCISFRLLNLGSAPTPNLTLGMGIFQALSLLHPSNFQCRLGLLFGLLSSSHLPSLFDSLFQISLLLFLTSLHAIDMPPPRAQPSSVLPVQCLKPKPRSRPWTSSLPGKGVQAGSGRSSEKFNQ